MTDTICIHINYESEPVFRAICYQEGKERGRLEC